MENNMQKHTLIILLVTICVAAAVPTSADVTADAVLKAAGFDKGLCLVVGDTDGKLTAALAKASRMYVQGCTKNESGIQAARKELVTSGVADRSSIVLREDAHLPYADNLINLVVCADLGNSNVSAAEVLRVLAPGGIGFLGGAGKAGTELKKMGVTNVKTANGFLAFTKPLDPRMDDWTHIKGSADLSYTNSDKLVGPWKEIRWIADPRWGSLYMTYGGLVTAGGCMYYKENHSFKGMNQWHLVARDAYNGLELWRIKSGGIWKKSYHITDYTLCCDDSRVYLLEGKVLVTRDGKTGKKVKDFSPGFSPTYATVSGRFLVLSARGRMAVLDKESGKTLWKRTTGVHPASDGSTVYVLTKGGLEAVDISTGQSKWQVKPTAKLNMKNIRCKGSVVYVVSYEKWGRKGQVIALDAASGKQLWMQEGDFKQEVLPFKDEVWCLGTVPDPDSKKKKKVAWKGLVLDSRTGREKHKYPVSAVAKCFGSKGAEKYIMYMNGTYVERATGKTFGNRSTRSPCRLGQHPANGLTYFMPHHCDCGVSLRGFLALSKPGSRKWFTDDTDKGKPRLFSAGGSSSNGTEGPDDWPIYRANMKRGNSTTTKVPSTLKKLWSMKLGVGRMTQATAAYGAVFVAENISGRVFACDAATGKELWSFVAAGRVEFPPALYKGMCLFGTGAGSVYCLDAKSGKKLWRLRAAPVQKIICDRNRFDSPWPVNGGVLPLNGLVHFSVGRSGSQSGGLSIFGVEAASGTVKWRTWSKESGDMILSDGKKLRHVSRFMDAATGKSPWIPHNKKPKGLLFTTRYLNAVSVVDYMATVEPNLSGNKHIELTNGRITGELLAFTDKFDVAAWRYRFGVPKEMMKKGKHNHRFIYAKENGKTKWLIDEDIKQQAMGLVLAGDYVYTAGRPTSYDPNDKSELWILSAKDGKNLQTLPLEGIPVYDGLSAANGRLYLATEGGMLICLGR
jgi:outer membrane protein assembly factor BamB